MSWHMPEWLRYFNPRHRDAADEVALEEQEDDQHRQRRHHRAGHQQIPDRAIAHHEEGQPERQGAQTPRY